MQQDQEELSFINLYVSTLLASLKYTYNLRLNPEVGCPIYFFFFCQQSRSITREEKEKVVSSSLSLLSEVTVSHNHAAKQITRRENVLLGLFCKHSSRVPILCAADWMIEKED
jgi:hypothetical protein